MDTLNAIWQELQSCEETLKDVLHIRVTKFIPQGIVAALPLTPERLRHYARLVGVGEGCVEADLAELGWKVEILVHPTDFSQMLSQGRGLDPCSPKQVLGIPVIW